MRSKKPHDDGLQFQIAPMIDVIFILILFFMCSAGAVKVENHLSMTLPGTVASGKPLRMPDEQIIEIHNNGQIVLNEVSFQGKEAEPLPQLVHVLRRFREAAKLTGNEAMVTVSPESNAKYQRVIDVMNACADAGISNITFELAAK